MEPFPSSVSPVNKGFFFKKRVTFSTKSGPDPGFDENVTFRAPKHVFDTLGDDFASGTLKCHFSTLFDVKNIIFRPPESTFNISETSDTV